MSTIPLILHQTNPEGDSETTRRWSFLDASDPSTVVSETNLDVTYKYCSVFQVANDQLLYNRDPDLEPFHCAAVRDFAEDVDKCVFNANHPEESTESAGEESEPVPPSGHIHSICCACSLSSDGGETISAYVTGSRFSRGGLLGLWDSSGANITMLPGPEHILGGTKNRFVKLFPMNRLPTQVACGSSSSFSNCAFLLDVPKTEYVTKIDDHSIFDVNDEEGLLLTCEAKGGGAVSSMPTIHVFDARDIRRPIRDFFISCENDICYDPGTDTFFVTKHGYGKKTVQLLDATDGKPINELVVKYPIEKFYYKAINFPELQTFVTWSSRHPVEAWDSETGLPKWKIEPEMFWSDKPGYDSLIPVHTKYLCQFGGAIPRAENEVEMLMEADAVRREEFRRKHDEAMEEIHRVCNEDLRAHGIVGVDARDVAASAVRAAREVLDGGRTEETPEAETPLDPRVESLAKLDIGLKGLEDEQE